MFVCERTGIFADQLRFWGFFFLLLLEFKVGIWGIYVWGDFSSLSAIDPLLAGPASPSSICGALGAWLGGWTGHVQLGKTMEEMAEEQRIEFLRGGGLSRAGRKQLRQLKKNPFGSRGVSASDLSPCGPLPERTWGVCVCVNAGVTFTPSRK